MLSTKNKSPNNSYDLNSKTSVFIATVHKNQFCISMPAMNDFKRTLRQKFNLQQLPKKKKKPKTHLEINLGNELKDLSTENYKTLQK